MPVQINLGLAENVQLRLLSEGVTELNSTMMSATGSPSILVSKDGDLCAHSYGGALISLTVDSLATLLRSTCIPGRMKKNDEDPEDPIWVEEPKLPRDLVRAYIETQHWHDVPRIKQIARAPIVRNDFTIRWEPGWDVDTECWVTEGLKKNTHFVDDGFDIKRVFEQFPLIDERLVADCFAAAFTPLLSTAIGTPIPGLIVSARKVGSGKTELAKFCSILGNGGKMFTTWRGSNELSKMINTYIAEDQRAVIFDNIKSDIDSTEMESVITSRQTSYRKMYSHASSNIRSNTTWFFTANGAIVSPDMVRRCIVVMLDKDAHPKGWDGLWVPFLETNEAAFVTLMCHMIEEWRDAGCKMGSVDFSNFTEWSLTVSGILEHAGITGMWESRTEVVSEAIQTDDEDDMPILEAIASVMGGGEWGSGELWETVNDGMGMYSDPKATYVRTWLASTGRVSSSSKKPAIPTARALHPMIGKTFDGCNIRLEKRMVSGNKRYQCVTNDGTLLPVKARGAVEEKF